MVNKQSLKPLEVKVWPGHPCLLVETLSSCGYPGCRVCSVCGRHSSWTGWYYEVRKGGGKWKKK